MQPPSVQSEPDWEEFHLPFDIGAGRSMLVDTAHGPKVRMRFFKRRGDGALVGRVWFGDAAFGPPGFAHGGVVAFVFDEAMGSGAWLAGYACVAANLNVDFVEMTPLGEDCLIEARVVEVRPKRLEVEARLTLADRLLVRGRGVFARLREDRVALLRDAEGTLPDLSGFLFAD